MAFERPVSFEVCKFYTRRSIGSSHIEVWVLRAEPELACINYTCPHCKHHSSKKVPYVRKRISGIDTFRFQCDSCGKNIDITRKLKEKK